MKSFIIIAKVVLIGLLSFLLYSNIRATNKKKMCSDYGEYVSHDGINYVFVCPSSNGTIECIYECEQNY